jgi:hypothetical protein
MPPEPPPAFAMRTTSPATTARPTTIPPHTFQVQPLRRCMPLELSMPGLLRSSSAASASLPFPQRLDARATSNREGDEDHRVGGSHGGTGGESPFLGSLINDVRQPTRAQRQGFSRCTRFAHAVISRRPHSRPRTSSATGAGSDPRRGYTAGSPCGAGSRCGGMDCSGCVTDAPNQLDDRSKSRCRRQPPTNCSPVAPHDGRQAR